MTNKLSDNKADLDISALPDTDQAAAAKRSATIGKPPARSTKTSKPIAPMHKRLVITWLLWLAYRLLAMPLFISMVNPNSPDILGGIVWYGLWLLPAFIFTPAIFKGRSPYVLLVGSMLTLVYLGASGVTLFVRLYGSGWLEILLYSIDFALLMLINTWLFLLLKRLPSMNNVIKKPRSH
ncbi:hypothetical protein [Psychrobacter immobilis]|uniref:hypothetical protein n=1 Tax=Psychrobacter sp. M13 TaxID=3067275 RepID=UPI00296FF665